MIRVEEILSQLKTIRPDRHYTEQSKRLILATTKPSNSYLQGSVLEVFRFSFATVASAALIVVILGGFHYLETRPLPLKLTGLDPRTLHAEADELAIDISLAELDYYQSQNEAVSSALRVTESSDPVYFEKIILNQETESINLNDPTFTDIDKALSEIIE